jgi:hypothetical protein
MVMQTYGRVRPKTKGECLTHCSNTLARLAGKKQVNQLRPEVASHNVLLAFKLDAGLGFPQ